MAMEIVKVIEEAHESSITAIAYNKVRKEIYSSADGDKVIKVRPTHLFGSDFSPSLSWQY